MKILVVDDEENIRLILKSILTDEGYTVETARDGADALDRMERFRPHIVLMDKNMPRMSGIPALVEIKKSYPETIVVIITAHGDVTSAVEAMKCGAYDYIEKPFDNDHVLQLLKRADSHYRLRTEVDTFRQSTREKRSFPEIIGESTALKQVLDHVSSVCETNATVLITGESGTGKELIAKAIHHHSPRRHKPLVTVNCGAIPLQLIESELFGHEKGAFTDAKETKIGKFELADGGTLFLDEIGELSLDAQVKLLRVLEDKKIMRVGGHREIPVDIRLVSATNRNLQQKVEEGQFRLDLYYRLNIFTILLPPLRERKEDIPPLVEFFIRKHNPVLQTQVTGCSPEVYGALTAYPWPGNIRDLDNAVQSAMILAKKGDIQMKHLPLRVHYRKPEQEDPEPAAAPVLNMNDMIMHNEREMILKILEKCKYNRTKTAQALGISRKTLFNKMQKYGLLDKTSD